MAEPMRKDEAHELVNRMLENATWDDLIEEIYVRQVIEQGLAYSNKCPVRLSSSLPQRDRQGHGA